MNLAFFQYPGSIMQRCLDVVRCQRGVSLADFAKSGPLFEQFQNQIHHDASSFEAGFTVADVGVDGNIILDKVHQRHNTTLPPFRDLAAAKSMISPCDVNKDNATNVVDVQGMVNQALGTAACAADINKDGACNVIDVQRVTNAALGGACVSQ